MSYLMQAKASDTGALHFWSSETADFAGEGYAGTGDPEDIAIFLRPSLSSSGPASAPVVTQAQAVLGSSISITSLSAVQVMEMPVTILEGRKLSLSWSILLAAVPQGPAELDLYFEIGPTSGLEEPGDLLLQPTGLAAVSFPGSSETMYHPLSGSSPILGAGFSLPPTAIPPGDYFVKVKAIEFSTSTDRCRIHHNTTARPTLQLVQYV